MFQSLQLCFESRAFLEKVYSLRRIFLASSCAAVSIQMTHNGYFVVRSARQSSTALVVCHSSEDPSRLGKFLRVGAQAISDMVLASIPREAISLKG